MSTSFGDVPSTAKGQPTPFTVAIADDKLQEMYQLIKAAHLGPVTYEGLQKDRKYGITREWLSDAKEAWLKFDWRTTEKELEPLPQFKLSISDSGDDFDIHFMAIFSHRPDAIPILMLHGWPGSYLEFTQIVRHLMTTYTPDTLPYHIVVPSLPGYAFSSAPPLHRNFGTEDMASIVHRLMVQLGFGESGYAVQGGDIGSRIARILAVTQPRVRAAHLNFCHMADPGTVPESAYTPAERQGLERLARFNETGRAYALEHNTRPATIGLVLSASPLALLAWVGEKFLDWTDADPPLGTVLEAVSLYWLTDCFAATLYPYRRSDAPRALLGHDDPAYRVEKPLGFSWFPREIAPVPRAWVETTGNLVHFRTHESGGHFAALEKPLELFGDVEDFLKQVWSTTS